MRTSEEVLAFVNEQIGDIQNTAKEYGLRLPIALKVEDQPNQQRLEEKYKSFYILRLFIQGDI